jgi:branched-chain amino acid transport system substrate-binding protein
MAVEEENTASLPGSLRIALVTRDEGGPWGQVSTEIVHMVFDDQAVALVTSPEGSSAHLAEQVGNKIGVPVVTLSSDTTTTEINLPWIFRVGPTDAAQAQAFAHDIYGVRKLQHVVLIAQNDHDGRAGGEEFVEAARATNEPDPVRVGIDSLLSKAPSPDLASAQAVVIWTDAATASAVLASAREAATSAPVYLCRKALEGEENKPICATGSGCPKHGAEEWIAAPPANPNGRAKFVELYRKRFGSEPSLTAAEAYDAVRILASALSKSGPNRARLRDALSQVSAFNGASGIISFDHAGNDTTELTLLRLR